MRVYTNRCSVSGRTRRASVHVVPATDRKFVPALWVFLRCRHHTHPLQHLQMRRNAASIQVSLVPQRIFATMVDENLFRQTNESCKQREGKPATREYSTTVETHEGIHMTRVLLAHVHAWAQSLDDSISRNV